MTLDPDSYVSLVRFEEDAPIPFADDLLALDELFPAPTCVRPTQGSGPVGFTAVFDGATTCVQAKDLDVGGTILPRDITIAAIVKWDLAAQDVAGTPGTIIARGLGNGALEYMPFALELHVVNAGARLGEARWLWNTSAGVLKTQTGGAFVVPLDYFILTATRRWVSPTQAVIRYYVNDQPLGEVVTLDGDIASSVDGTTTIGARYTGAAYANFLAGEIDELLITNYEMCLEEIEATHARISDHQVDGVRLIKELLPPGLPISSNPESRVQGDIASMGIGLGFAMGLVENFRNNTMPDRSFGKTLRRWEGVTRQPAKQGDALDVRRGRVIGHLSSRSGVSVPGLERALAGVLATDASNLQCFAFSNTVRDSFAALDTLRWRFDPAARWDVLGGELRVQAPAGTYSWDGTHLHSDAVSALIAVERARSISSAPIPPSALSMVASIDPHTLPAGGEVGLVFYNWVAGHMLFVGLRNDAGAYKVGYQRYANFAAVDGAFQVIAVSALQKHWFRIRPKQANFYAVAADEVKFDLSYSTVGSLEADYITTPDIAVKRDLQWAGFYFRTFAAYAGGLDARFGAFALRNALGTRPYWFYVYRDPGLAGVADRLGADRIVQRQKHAFTIGHVTEALVAKFDDPYSLFDVTPLGCE